MELKQAQAGHRVAQPDAAAIDALFADIAPDQPGVALGLSVHGQVSYRRGFGRAHMEQPTSLSPMTKMRIASTSKHFCALAYMLLCEDGRAGFDDAVGRHLPELGAAARSIPMSQLMTHVSGLRDVDEIVVLLAGVAGAVPFAEQLSFYDALASVDAPPGQCWSYNNGGYTILTAVIERIADAPLEDVLRHRILEPIGMADTGLRRLDSDFVEGSATLHMTGADGRFNRAYLGRELAGAGGIVSTVDDMLRWLAHMESPIVGQQETWRLMLRPAVLNNGVSTDYGLGLIAGHYHGFEVLYHPGAVLGGNCQMIKVPALELDLIVMSNRQDKSAVAYANAVLDLALGIDRLGATGLSSACTGIFRSVFTGRVVQLIVRDDQQFVAIDGIELPMEWQPDGTLRHPIGRAYLRHILRPVGRPSTPEALELDDFGNRDRLDAISPMPDRLAIGGDYVCHEIAARAFVDDADGQARLAILSRFGIQHFQLTYLAADVWQLQSGHSGPTSGIVDFDEAGFCLSTLRLRKLRFTRAEAPVSELRALILGAARDIAA